MLFLPARWFRRRRVATDKTATSVRSKSIVIPKPRHPRHRRREYQRVSRGTAVESESERARKRERGGERGEKKNNTPRHSPFSLRYAGSKVLIFHRLVLACRTNPARWPPPLARVREVTVPLSGEIYVRQQNENREENDDDDGERGGQAPVPDDDFDDLIETSSRH